MRSFASFAATCACSSSARFFSIAACDLFAHAVEPRAGFLALLGRKLAEFLELLGEPAALAERADAHLFERRDIGRARNRAERFRPARVEILRVAFSHGRSLSGFRGFFGFVESGLRLLRDAAKPSG